MTQNQETRRASDPAAAAPARSARRATPRGSPEPTLGQLLWTIADGRWIVLGITAVALVVGGLVAGTARPVYEADVLVKVDKKAEPIPGMESVSAMPDDATGGEGEIELLRSKALVGTAVDALALDVDARPRTLPLVGGALSRAYRGPGLAPPRLGLSRFAWGGERIRVTRLDVPDRLLDEPLVLRALDGGRYRLVAPKDPTVVVEGSVGELAMATAGPDPVRVLVSELVARPGTELLVRKEHRDDTVARLRTELRVTEQGKDTGVFAIALRGSDPQRVAGTLQALSTTYVRQKADRTASEARRRLEFLESQLPRLKANMDRAEAALHAFREKNGSVDLTIENQLALQQIVAAEKSIADAEVKRTELERRYTATHPEVTALASQIETLRAQRAALEVRLRALPAKDLESVRLTRDVNVSTELYVLLAGRVQQLQIAQAGQVPSARIVDAATAPMHPVPTKAGATLALALVLGLGSGISAVLARRQLRRGADDPDEVEAETGVPVIATVPESAAQAALSRRSKKPAALSTVDPGDVAIEDLRSVRTALQSSLRAAPNHVVSIGGPAPGVGKSFVCANLALLVAAAHRRVLVIDGDLRRGGLHRLFGLERAPGLADVLSGETALDSAIRPTGTPHLDVLTTGKIPVNPSELLAGDRLQELLSVAHGRYDLVLVDTPSVLAVTDAALLARHAGVNLMVLRAGQNSLDEIALALQRLAQNGIKVEGAILNGVRAASGRYGKYGRYRRYDYRGKTA